MTENNTVNQNFSHFAKSYNENAFIQKEVAKKLCDFVKNEIQINDKIIDLGCGTGFIAENIDNLERLTQIDSSKQMCEIASKKAKTIQADLNNLNLDLNAGSDADADTDADTDLDAGAYDVVLSSFTMHWLENLNNSLYRIKKLLKKEGLLAFSIPVKGTLYELKQAFKHVGLNKINNFPKFEHIYQTLKQLGFNNIEFIFESRKENFNSVSELLKNIKNTGASTQLSKNSDILSKSQYLQMQEYYLSKFSDSEGIYSKWNVLYIKCRKSDD